MKTVLAYTLLVPSLVHSPSLINAMTYCKNLAVCLLKWYATTTTQPPIIAPEGQKGSGEFFPRNFKFCSRILSHNICRGAIDEFPVPDVLSSRSRLNFEGESAPPILPFLPQNPNPNVETFGAEHLLSPSSCLCASPLLMPFPLEFD